MNKVYWETELTQRCRLQLVHGDITRENVDVIVNAANKELMHHGGVAADIARAAGSTLQEESDAWVRQHGFVSHNQPAITSGGKLPCRYVIHAVGPVWGSGKEEEKLAAALNGCLALAENMKLVSITFPAISTGIYGFPMEHAASVFLRVLRGYPARHPSSSLCTIRIILHDYPALKVFLNEFSTFNKTNEPEPQA